MKKLLTVLAIVLCTAGSCWAEDYQTASEACDEYAYLARSAMKLRQDGADLRLMLYVAQSSNLPDSMKSDAIGIIQRAWSYPVVPGRDWKERTVQEFGSKIYDQCMEVRAK